MNTNASAKHIMLITDKIAFGSGVFLGFVWGSFGDASSVVIGVEGSVAFDGDSIEVGGDSVVVSGGEVSWVLISKRQAEKVQIGSSCDVLFMEKKCILNGVKRVYF